MLIEDAYNTLQRILDPMPLDGFLDQALGRRFVKVAGDTGAYRAGLLGPDPEQLMLSAYGAIAPHLGFHAAQPLGPPPVIEPVANPVAFKAKIESFQALGYTVRLPQPRGLSSGVDALLRALEVVLHKPATAEVFWSRGEAKAPVHHDDYDIIVIQLRGYKRWFISTDRSELPNAWETIPPGPPTLDRCDAVEVKPGDLLYLPRGTKHRVDALSDSIHLSVGFVPLTLREAIIAALDHLSDLDRPLRESVSDRLGSAVRNNDFKALSPKVRDGLARLLDRCRSDDFVAQAMQRRSSRAIKELRTPGAIGGGGAITANSLVRHDALAICHVMVSPDKIDFSHPGGHIYIHRGVEESVRYIADTREFRVGDIPGAIGDDVRLALVDKFVTSGFLQVAPE
jgi:hypothetical protein